MLLIARLVLSGVFLVAGLAKLKDQAGSRQSLIDFGLPQAVAKPFGALLPICEVIVAIGLIPALFAWMGAIGALVLLVLFIVGITVALVRGKKPDCHCFGQLQSKPIGWDLVGRNIALAVIAAMLIYAGPRQPSFWGWMNASSQSAGGSVVIVLALAGLVLLVFQSWAIFQLIQQSGRVLLRLDAIEKQLGGNVEEAAAPPQGLPVGDTAPEFELETLEGGSVSLQQLRGDGKPVMLLFTHPGCGPCTALLPEAAAWQRDIGARFQVVMVSQGTKDENLAKMREHGIAPVLLQHEHEISDRYDALGTPSAVLVRPDGTVGSPVATGAEAIRTLVSNTINEPVAGLVADPLQEGANAPPLIFPDLEGRMLNLSHLGDKRAILLFWNPGCGFCQQMTEDLKLWEKKAAKAATEVVIISSGTAEANAKQGFRSRIVLDQNFSAGKVFGATGTPSAVLLDDEGRIASKVAVGRQEILDSVFSAQIASELRR